MIDSDFDPVFTNIGLNTIAAAINTGNYIQLSKIKIGDCINDIEYVPSPTDIALQNTKLEIDVATVHYLDLKASTNATMRITGKLDAINSIDMIAREYGIFDVNGNMIIVGRLKDIELLAPSFSTTGAEFIINISLSSTQMGFIVDNEPANKYITIDDLNAHINAVNPHNITKASLLLSNVTNTSDENKPTNPAISKMLQDINFAIGFSTRANNTITKSGNIISLTTTVDTIIYKHSTKYTIPISVKTLDTTALPNGGYYIGYNPIDNVLYHIVGTPDFMEDILVAWFYKNSTGIIWLADERHSVSENPIHHRTHHLENGAVWTVGGNISYNLNNAANVAISLSTPIGIADEDLVFSITHNATPVNPYEQNLTNAKLPVLYLDTNGIYQVDRETDLSWLYNASGALYNNITTGALDNVPNNKYFCYWLIITTDQAEPIKLIVGRSVHDSIEASASEELASYNLPIPELVGAYKIVLKKDSVAYTNNNANVVISQVYKIARPSRRDTISSISHDTLIDRNTAGQHNVASVTGLREELDRIAAVVPEPEKSLKLIGNAKSVESTEHTDVNGKITLKVYQSDSRKIPYVDDPIFLKAVGTDYGATVTKYAGAALAYDGNIYFAPYNATQVLSVNPVTNVTSTVGAALAVLTNKYIGIVLHPNGKLYCPPFNASQAIEIDPIAKTAGVFGSVYGTAILSKYLGAALHPNGKIYCAPHKADQILIIDPMTGATILIGTAYGTTTNKWTATILANNNKLYAIPAIQNKVLKIDADTNATTLIGSDYGAAIDGKWQAGCLAPNGKIYCPPFNANQVLCIDPSNDTTTLIGSDYSSLGSGKWGSICLAPNGKLYCAPRTNATQVLEINPNDNTTRLVGYDLGTGDKYLGMALAPNGNIYCSAMLSNQILEIETFPKSGDFQSYLKLPALY